MNENENLMFSLFNNGSEIAYRNLRLRIANDVLES